MTERTTFNSIQTELGLRIRQQQLAIEGTTRQLTSNLKSDLFSGLGLAETSVVLDLGDDKSRAKGFLNSLEIGETRIRLGASSLETAAGQLGELERITSVSPADTDVIGDFARNAIWIFAGALNATDGSRSLFAGTRFSGPAVAVHAPGEGPVADGVSVIGSAAAGNTDLGWRFEILSEGDDSDIALRIGENLDLVPQVTIGRPADGDNPFVGGLRALVTAADFGTSANPAPAEADVTAVRTGAREAVQGETGGTGLQSLTISLNLQLRKVDVVRESHTDFLAHVEKLEDAALVPDRTEAVTQLNARMLLLEASYRALARISQESLLNHLR